MDLITRDKSLLTGKSNLEELYRFSDFPVFMGCVDTPVEEDLKTDMIWDICRDTGLIQLRQLLPLDILYLNQHNDGTGQVWEEHYAALAKFLVGFCGNNVLEIGGAHDKIASKCLDDKKDLSWTIVEPHPDFVKDERIKIIKKWFDNSFVMDGEVDTIVHSHVFEHVYDPVKFIEHIGKFLKKGQRHIFSIPNMLPMLQNNFTNCLNLEHTVFLTEEVVDYLLAKNGFKILAKEYYGDPHSIFYATEKAGEINQELPFDSKYQKYKEVFQGFVDYHKNAVAELNAKIAQTDKPVYLFGAHIFSQFLLEFGLDKDRIECVLDNSPIKQGKRLYGTDLQVASPRVLKDVEAVVILKAGIYNEEIKKDILENINDRVKFW